MAPSDDDLTDGLFPAEAARARRRDHDAAAAGRAGMRTGLAKQFRQVLDAQVKRARAAGRRARGGTTNPSPVEPEAPTAKHDRGARRSKRSNAHEG